MSRCIECDTCFDGDTMFVETKEGRICKDCIDRMSPRELLEKLGVELDCIGFPEPERC